MAVTGIRTHILIGRFEIFRCQECEIEYRRHAHLSAANILLPDASGRLYQEIKTNDPVIIRMGYRDRVPDEWTGSVSKIAPADSRDQILIKAVGIERPLSATPVKMSFENETPSAIIRYCIETSGMIPGRIDSLPVVFPRFVASGIPVWQVARQCEHTCRKGYGLDMKSWSLWVGKDGLVNWGSFLEETTPPLIATGSTLLTHFPAPGDQMDMGVVETLLMPGFRRCMQFRLKDLRRGIDRTYTALAVRHVICLDTVRTFLSYGEEHEKF